MDTLSVEYSISKQTSFEGSQYYDSDDNLNTKRKAISNEVIHKNDILLSTYKVMSDAISGGMGSVWHVLHTGWNKELAMKRPHPQFFAEGSDRRKIHFINECENWIDLGLHPNIVTCYYVRDISGVPTIFSEWMDGGSLKDRINDRSLYDFGRENDETDEILLHIAIQTVRGLMYSHEKGLLHLDIKPSNILLSGIEYEEYDAKLADFGLAKAKNETQSDKDLKITGYTESYCPREQINNDKAEKWMDLYSWALSVLEMYKGKRDWEKGSDVADNPEKYFRNFTISLPSGLKNLLIKCILEKYDNIREIDRKLCEIYKNAFDYSYPDIDEIITETANSLNNKALSFIDIKKEKEAYQCWKKALEKDPRHIDSIFNRLLYRYRKKEISIDQIEYLLVDIDYTGYIRECFEQFVKEEGGSLQLNTAGHKRVLPPTLISCSLCKNNEKGYLNITNNGWSVYGVSAENGIFTYSVFDTSKGRNLFVKDTLINKAEKDFMPVICASTFGNVVSADMFDSNDQKYHTYIFDTDKRAEIARFDKYNGIMNEYGTLIAFTDDDGITVYKINSKEICYHQHNCFFISFSDSSVIVYLKDEKKILIRDLSRKPAKDRYIETDHIPYAFFKANSYTYVFIDNLGYTIFDYCDDESSRINENAENFLFSLPTRDKKYMLLLFEKKESDINNRTIDAVIFENENCSIDARYDNFAKESPDFITDLITSTRYPEYAVYLPKKPAQYRVSRIESTKERKRAQDEFKRSIKQAEAYLDQTDYENTIKTLDYISEKDNFKTSAEPLLLRSIFCKYLRKERISRIVPYAVFNDFLNIEWEKIEQQVDLMFYPKKRSVIPDLSKLPESIDNEYIDIILKKAAEKQKEEADMDFSPQDIDLTKICSPSLSPDKRFLSFLYNDTVSDKETKTAFYVFDTKYNKLFYKNDDFFKNEKFINNKAVPENENIKISVNMNGKRALLCEGIKCKVIILSSMKEISCPTPRSNSSIKYSSFLQDDRFFIVQYENGYVAIADIKNGTCKGINFFGDLYGDISFFSDDCFYIRKDGKLHLNFIEWKYDTNNLPPLSKDSGYKMFGDFSVSNRVLVKYDGSDEHVIIPPGIKAIGNSAFKGCETILKITMSDTVDTIDSNAFKDCINLKSISLSGSLKKIGLYAFKNCKSLKDIKLPAGLYDIDCSAFDECISLEEINIPPTVSKIHNNAFSNCTNLKKAVLPKSGISLGGSIFKNCINLEKVNLPSDLKELYVDVFYGCEKLKKITIPEKTSEIYGGVFMGCKNLKTIEIPEHVIKISDKAIGYDKSGEKYDGLLILAKNGSEGENYAKRNGFNHKVPFKLSSVFNNQHSNNTNANFQITNSMLQKYKGSDKKAAVPSGVRYIIRGAFYGTDIKSIYLPDSVEHLSERAFSSCINLENIRLPHDLRVIPSNAFDSCRKLENIILPEGLAVIGENAFKDCVSLKEIVIPCSTGYIGKDAFKGCKNLEKVVFMNKPLIIDEGAFSDCEKLQCVTLHINTWHIGQHAFAFCNDTLNKSFFINAPLNSKAREYAKNNGILFSPTACEELDDSLPEQIQNISSDNTEYDISDENFLIENKTIKEYNGDDINVVIPEDIKKIEKNAFGKIKYIECIYIPDSVTEIGREAFSECINLKTVRLSKNIKSLPYFCFNRCRSLQSIEIPNGIKTIESWCFNMCTNLKEIYIPSSVKSIGEKAFGNLCDRIDKNFIIKCKKGCEAERYAVENGINISYVSDCKVNN